MAYLTEMDGPPASEARPGGSFRQWWPPKYKRGKTREERLAAMGFLHRLLTHPSLGLAFDPPLAHPAEEPRLQRLANRYDACLATIPGVY